MFTSHQHKLTILEQPQVVLLCKWDI